MTSSMTFLGLMPLRTSLSRCAGGTCIRERCCTTSLDPFQSAAALARQIAWRDFFADVLFQRPEAVSEPIRHEFGGIADR